MRICRRRDLWRTSWLTRAAGIALEVALLGQAFGLAAEVSPAVTPELREQAEKTLWESLAHGQRWTKVRAAEYLLMLDYDPSPLAEVFEQELARDGRTPEYRIGVWRVLARIGAHDRRGELWVGKLDEVALDQAAPDQAHALSHRGRDRSSWRAGRHRGVARTW